MNDHKKCDVDGCEKQARTKSAAYCQNHYARWQRNGDPTVDGWSIDRPRRTGLKKKAIDRKKCAMCRKVKPRDQFYVKDNGTPEGWLSAYCRSCLRAYYKAKRDEARASRPPKPVRYCESGVCDKEARARYKGEGPWLCFGHWQQARDGKEFTPLRPKHDTSASPGLRRCTSCEKVKAEEAFHLKADKVNRQATCKSCAILSNSFHQHKAKGRLEEALGVTESMPERMRIRLLTKYATVFNEAVRSDISEGRKTA